MQKFIDNLRSTLPVIINDIKDSLGKIKFNHGVYEVEYNKGIDAYQTGNYSTSVKYYRNAIKLDSARPEAYYNLGLAYMAGGSPDEAEISFRKAIQLNSGDVDAYYNLGLLLHKKGKFEDALNQFYRTIELRNEDPDNFYCAGLVFTDMKKFDEAHVYISKAIEFAPNNIEYVFALAMVCDKKSEITVDPDDVEEAINSYINALKLDPQNEEGNFRLAICYARKGLWDECVNYCKKVIEINSKSAEAYNQYGLALFCKDDIDNSIIMYRKAAVLKPDLAAIYYNLGNAFERQGDFKAAIEAFTKYINLSPNQSDVTSLKEHIANLQKSIDLKS